MMMVAELCMLRWMLKGEQRRRSGGLLKFGWRLSRMTLNWTK